MNHFLHGPLKEAYRHGVPIATYCVLMPFCVDDETVAVRDLGNTDYHLNVDKVMRLSQSSQLYIQGTGTCQVIALF